MVGLANAHRDQGCEHTRVVGAPDARKLARCSFRGRQHLQAPPIPAVLQQRASTQRAVSVAEWVLRHAMSQDEQVARWVLLVALAVARWHPGPLQENASSLIAEEGYSV